MDLLMDTHILIWTLADDLRLSNSARELIRNGGNSLYVSIASIWEIAIKHAKHPADMVLSGEKAATTSIEAGYQVIPISLNHVMTLETLRQKEGATHSDPFDRILISQAKAEGMRFLTHDSRMSEYDEPCILHV